MNDLERCIEELRSLNRSGAMEPDYPRDVRRRVYVVRYSNYEPAEVDSLWESLADAERRADACGDGWCVEQWPIERYVRR